jgi:hypothetical protein
MVLVDAGGVGTLILGEAYGRYMLGMWLTSLVHGHFLENSVNRNGIYIRYFTLRQSDVGCFECSKGMRQDVR